MIARAVLVVMLLSVAGPAVAEMIQGQARVIDGDTIEIGDRRIRLYGIDAPEMHQTCDGYGGKAYPCGFAASANLMAFVGSFPVVCDGDKSDRYGRLIAVCSVNGQDLGGHMVDRGWAVAYRKYSGLYVDRELKAREAKLNLWSGEFEMPWEWRKGE